VDAVREALAPARLAATDWVVFTSANGVAHTWNVLKEEGRGAEAFGAARFAVVGTATEEALRAHGAAAHLVADEFRGEGVAKALLGAIEAGGRVLILRAQAASDVLPDALLGAGITVDVVAVYRTRPSPEGTAEIRRLLAAGDVDALILSSGSTVDAICDAIGPSAAALLSRVTVACIGPVTAAAAAARGVRVDVVPAVATFRAAVEALEARFRAI
jgi:uroporphyrinogen III methyltransferase/synthase